MSCCGRCKSCRHEWEELEQERDAAIAANAAEEKEHEALRVKLHDMLRMDRDDDDIPKAVGVLIANLEESCKREEAAIARAEKAEGDFKNFHRSLCDRFGYCHDPIDWRRDQCSLEEHIARKIQVAESNHAADAETVRRERDAAQAEVARMAKPSRLMRDAIERVMEHYSDGLPGHMVDELKECMDALAEVDAKPTAPRFYLLSLKHTKGGDSHLTWWRPDSKGYCWSLTHAGLYDEAEAKRTEQASEHDGVRSCVAVPEAVAKAVAYAVVENSEANLAKLGTSHAEWRKAGRL